MSNPTVDTSPSRPAAARSGYPARIVCLTEETTEVLYRIGAGDLVVGVSKFTMRPKEAREKPKIAAFIDADIEEIINLKPDVVLAFSDLQADIASQLIRKGLPVYTYNQRSVPEILTTIRQIGAVVGYHEEAETLVKQMESNIKSIQNQGNNLRKTPTVYFEEWDDPLITGIQWVSEIIEIAGGKDLFPEFRHKSLAKERITNQQEVISRNPDVIIASWCGKTVRPHQIINREGFDNVTAVQNNRIHSLDSCIILQPGPAALTDGLEEIHKIIAACANDEPPPESRKPEHILIRDEK